MLNRPSRSLRRIAGSTSAIALATALIVPAQAQSINAPAPTVVSGSATFATTGTVDTITINSNTAVLDFTPNDTGVGGGPINFQNAGTTLRFDRIGQDFTVLNRIVPADPTRAVQFNGTVESRIVSTITNPGGNVWFYSPGGIILGSGAVFNVGSLLLSTADPTGGSGTITSTNVFNLSSVANSNAAVTIQPGAQIKALNEGSYVALVAPVVNQNGTVLVNGNAAYVAAEQATVTFSGGLFDIQVAVGSDGGGTPLTHNGSTAGPSSTGAADKHGIYMVAVPKNSAITMAIAPTGQLGFDVAASATIENGAVYLRTAEIVGLDPSKQIGARMQGAPTAPAPANINLALNIVNGANLISSPIEVQATNSLNVVLGQTAKFNGDASLYGGDQSIVTLEAGGKFEAAGKFAVSSYTAASGGIATFEARAGSEAKFGVFLGVSSNELGLFSQYGPNTPRALSGGSATVRASGATIDASGTGNLGGGAGGRFTLVTRAPTADGSGVSRLIIDQGGSVQALGTIGDLVGVRVSASPTIGATGIPRSGGTAGINIDNGQLKTDTVFVDAPSFGDSATHLGGTAELTIAAGGGSVAVTNDITLNAKVTGLPPSLSFPNVTATGGVARISTLSTSAASSISAGTITVDAGATYDPVSDPSKVDGGSAAGGLATVSIGAGGSLNVATALTMSVVARGSEGVAGGGGGAATQGEIRLDAFDGGAISFASAKLDADTFGGIGGAAATSTDSGGAGGAAIKGPGAFVFAGGGGTITGGKTQVLAIARSGAGGDGFSGTGFAGAGGAAEAGSAVISTDTGGKITLGDTFILAGAGAGDTGVGAANGTLVSGPAQGGFSTLNAKAGTIELASVVMATDVIGGNGLAVGSSGGDGFGGSAFVGATSGGALKIGVARFEVNSSATAGTGSIAGGKAVAGSANLGVEVGSTLETTATLVDFRVFAVGGGVTGGPGAAGSAQAGQSFFNFAGNATLAGGLLLNATATGGSGSATATVTGGSATGGNTFISVNQGATVGVANTVILTSKSTGGLGINGGNGGNATAGNTSINVDNGALSAAAFNLFVNASAGSGGGAPDGATAGGAGGAALTGSGASIFASNGGSVTGGNVFLDATAAGGTGGDGFQGVGPAGVGGAATAANTFAGVNDGQLVLADLTLQSNAIAGAGGTGAAQAPGTGVVATGGNATVNADNGLVQVANLSVRSNAFGNPARSLGANGNKAVAQNAAASANNNGTLKITGSSLDLSAEAFGGDASGVPGGAAVQAGEAVGGIASIFAGAGATVDSSATSVFLDASGDGGAEQGTGNVIGAIGRGGNARINANGGTIILRSSVSAIADGRGGDGGGTGAGGAGFGGEARLGTFGAAGASKVQVTGDLFLDTSGSGGGAELGIAGDGLGGTPPSTDTGPFDKGAYLVGIGGEVTIGGNVDMEASGLGGFSPAGGGAGVGGLTNFVSFGTAMTVSGTTFMDSSGSGGDAFSGAGGKGGAGKGGFVLLSSTSGGDSQGGGVIPVGTPSSISLGIVQLDASGQGGDGGSGAEGQIGGQGGDGTAGVANAIAQAGSGQLKTGDLFIFLQGSGGQGGDGGVAPLSGGLGGAGGQGGAGIGGFTNFGTASGPDTTGNNGSATFALANAFLFGIGGDGGAGDGSVTGGAGGLGSGGNGTLLSRGSPVITSTLSIDSSAFGGQGGTSGFAGAVQGAAGGAEGGAATVLITNRFMRTEPGSFTATDVTLSAGAFPSLGGTPGTLTAGQALVQITKSTATIGSLSLTTFGDAPPPSTFESGLLVDAGTLTVTDQVSVSAIGDVLLSVINGGTLTVPTFSINATGSLLPPAVGAAGLFNISGDFFADFGGNFVSTSDYNVSGSFDVSAGGDLQVGNVTSGASIVLNSVGSITAGNLSAGDSIEAIADAFLTAGNLVAGIDPAALVGTVILEGSAGVNVGDITAVAIDIDDGIATDSVTGITVGNVKAEDFSISSTKDVTLGTVTQGDFFPTNDFDLFGDVFLSAEGTLKATSIDAASDVRLFGGVAVSTGAISGGDSILIGSDAGVVTGDLTAGLANLATTTGDLEVFAFGSATVGNVKAARIDFQVGDPATTVAGSILAGNLSAETLTLDATGSITAGNIATGDLYSGIDTLADNYLIGIGALGDITLGKIDAFTSAGVGSVGGRLVTGAITANDSLLLLAATGVSTGGIVGGLDSNDSVFLSNTSIIQSNPDFAVLQDFDEIGGLFDINVLATAAPVRVGGPITLGGPVQVANFAAATDGAFQSGSIAAPARLFLDVGGTIAAGALSTGGGLFLTSDQSISVGDVVASSVDLNSKQDVTVGAVSASGTVIVNAAGLAAVNGQVNGNSIQVTSNDISIASGSGLNGGFSVTLVSTNGQTRFGGVAAGPGYVLDGAEAQGLRANSIELRSNGSATIGQMTLQGSDSTAANLVGPGGRLLINASGGGDLRVIDALVINNAISGSTGNRLTLNAGEGITIVTDSGGSVGMFGSSTGSLAGTIQLQSGFVRAATSSLLDQLSALTAAQRQQALAAPPSGSPRPEGYLQANRIEFRANELLIQNSNTASQFGGFSAGSGGAVLRGFSGNQADAIIFGRIADSSGTFKINQDAVPLLTLTDGEGSPSTVTATSTFNTCPFTGSCGTAPPPPPEEEPVSEMVAPVPVNVLAIVEDVLSSTAEPESVAALPTVTLVTTIDTGQLRTEPLITDPVTGGGNPSLWEAAPQSSDDERRPAQGPGDEE